MYLIVGLGNIGEKYLNTRHNVGFMFVDYFLKTLEKKVTDLELKEERKLKAEIAKINHENIQIILAKPSTYMNLSGDAVQNILNFYKIPIGNLVIIYDDIDLPLGNVRFREKGSAGTHNGMKDIIEKLRTENFKRIRIGIESRGEISPKEQDLHSFVLSNFKKEELAVLKQSLAQVTEKVEHLIST